MPSSPKKSSQQDKDKDKLKKKAADKPAKPAAGGDIRNFFGGAATTPKKAAAPPPKASQGKGTGDEPILIDSDDDKPVKKAAPVPKASTSKHFPAAAASSSKKRTISIESSPEPVKPLPKKAPAISSSKPRSSSSSAKAPAKRKSPLTSDSDASDSHSRNPVKRATKRAALVDSDSEFEEEEEIEYKPAKKTTTRAATKPKPAPKTSRKVVSQSESEEESEEMEDVKPKKKAPAKAKVKAPPKSKGQAKDDGDGDGDAEEKDEKPKFNYFAAKAKRAAGPSAPGSKVVPDGHPGALAGLTIVFTGELQSLGRDDAVELAKRYMAKVTSAPSGNTDYVVIGDNAGESKLTKIKELVAKSKAAADDTKKKSKTGAAPKKTVQMINEDEFLELIATRKGELNDQQKKALEKERQKIQDQADELARREREEEKLHMRKEKALANTGAVAAKKITPASAQLWTTKYAPKTIKEICGNKGNVEKLGEWLQNWDKSYRSGFKKPGKDGMGMYRAVLISGPPGIGKTTSAHLMAKAAGYSPIELNASDARSKKLIENSTNIDNTSLDGFFQGKGMQSTTVADVHVGKKTCLIMDEVDGMSGGDRGGVGAMNALIKKTKIPMILICNDRSLQKMKPLHSTTFNMNFRRPSAQEIRSRILSILFREKLKVPTNVVDQLVAGAGSDIRQVLNMLSTFKLSKSEMDFDDGKEVVRLNEKNTPMTPFTITDKLTGPYAFSRTSNTSVADKMELFFHDISFVPLFIQEHYPKTDPVGARNMDGPDKQMKNLELLSKAADSISDGDLVDRMIHGGEQHWSLLPLHAVTSAVIPASHIYGTIRQDRGNQAWGPAFPQWLGQNSKMGKLSRQLTDIQIRMRLRVSGGRDEIRQQYMPLLASKIVLPLAGRDGADNIDEVVETMDEYYLGKDDWDAFVELGVDTMREEGILKQIPTATKTSFTRTYNKREHPIAFHKGDMFAASKKKVADTGPAPDNDEVFEEDAPPVDDDEVVEDVNDYTKDKLIKAVKPKKAKK